MKPALVDLTSVSFVIAFALVLSPLARATTLAPLSLAQLTSSAVSVVHAECTGNQALWRDGEIWTVTSFRVLENWKGDSPQEVQVWMIGGRAGPVTSYVPGAPRFRAGEETVLFLEPAASSSFNGALSITAWGEGTFRIHRDTRTGEMRVTQDTAATPDFDPSSRTFRATGIRNWPLAKLKASVIAA
ncbi:MAG TPA: hypothetical protein VJN90_10300, partial [Candidatus Acidoferrales bacterium]|nr:hypothetical protein [Candidatus Acidoferrales bacterium]